MNTLQDKLQWFYSSIDADLALWDEATDGPWKQQAYKAEGKDVVVLINTGGFVLFDTYELNGAGESNAKAIARSRTGHPAALKALKSQVQWLEELTNAADGLYQNCPFEIQLNHIIDTYRKDVETP